MKKNIFTIILFTAMAISLPSSVQLFADSHPDDCVESSGAGPCSSSEVTRISNPLGSPDMTIWDLVDIVINLVQAVMIPIVVLFLIYAGFLFVTAQGNETKLTKAKTVLMYTIIGTAIIIGAEALSLLIQGTIDQLRTGI